jgi:hypothetical protein
MAKFLQGYQIVEKQRLQHREDMRRKLAASVNNILNIRTIVEMEVPQL